MAFHAFLLVKHENVFNIIFHGTLEFLRILCLFCVMKMSLGMTRVTVLKAWTAHTVLTAGNNVEK